VTAFLFHPCSDTSYDGREISRWNVVSTTKRRFSVPRVAVEPPCYEFAAYFTEKHVIS